MNKLQLFAKQNIKNNVPSLRAGDTVRIHEKITEGTKERIQIFEGLVIAAKHGSKTPSATVTIRKISNGVAVEKTLPLHLPSIQKIEIVKHDKVRRAKLYYVRHIIGKKKKKRPSAMLGLIFEEKEIQEAVEEETPTEQTAPENSPSEEQASTPSEDQKSEESKEAPAETAPKEEVAEEVKEEKPESK